MTGIKKFFQTLIENDVISQEPANYDAVTLKVYIAHLEAENAELRARLEKAEELPAKVGDRVFYINGFAPDFAPAAAEEFEIEEILIQKSTTIFRLIGVDTGIKTVVFLSWYNKSWFTELEAAEARLKEIKEKNNG